MDKLAAEKLSSAYYTLGQRAALSKLASVSLGDIQDAMEAQRALYQGSIEDRIGNTLENRRREGAILGTLLGGGLGAIGGGSIAGQKGKALAALGVLLGGGAGSVGGNLLGRASGLLAGAQEGVISALPGVRQTADFVSRPLDEY